MKKKVLTLDDLYSFFEQRNQTTVFSAKESGYNIAVLMKMMVFYELNSK